MKKLLIGASVLLLSTGAFAQTKMTGETARFGLKAGVNLSKFHASGNGADAFNDNVKNNVGFNVTAYGDLELEIISLSNQEFHYKIKVQNLKPQQLLVTLLQRHLQKLT